MIQLATPSLPILLLSLHIALVFPSNSFAKDDEPLVTRIYVIRRNFVPVPTKKSVVAHSALLLETDAGKTFVLEYMGDGKVYLTPAQQEVKSSDEKNKTAEIVAAGNSEGKTSRFNWTRQLLGQPLKKADNHTPEGLKAEMESIVKDWVYDLNTHQRCHGAQEDLRKLLGLDSKPYLFQE